MNYFIMIIAVIFCIGALIGLPEKIQTGMSADQYISDLDHLTIKRIPSPPKAVRYSRKYQENARGLYKHSFVYKGQQRVYYSYAPSGAKIQQMPTIVLLHGSGRSGISLVEQWRPLADREGLILIGPTSQGQGWDRQADPAWVVEATLRDAARKHPIDSSRVYLFGHSGGGMYGNYLLLKRSNLFAAAAFHAGSLLDPSHYSDSVKLPRTPPVLFILGDGDGLYNSGLVLGTAEAFARHGHQTEIQIIEGHDHWYYDIASFLNDRVWEFLKPHRL